MTQFLIWGKFRVFSQLFLRLLIVRTGAEEKIYSKVIDCFYLKVPKLVNLTNQRNETFEIIISSPCKRKLQQNQEKITKTKKNQIRPKQTKKIKLKLKQTAKTKKQKKKSFSKKEINVDKRELTSFGRRSNWKENQIDWIV